MNEEPCEDSGIKLDLKKDNPDAGIYYCLRGHKRSIYENHCPTCIGRTDTDRLNWMIENQRWIYKISDCYAVCEGNKQVTGGFNLSRQAIDTAMDKENGSG